MLHMEVLQVVGEPELVLVVVEHAYKVVLCWKDYFKYVAYDLGWEKEGLVDH